MIETAEQTGIKPGNHQKGFSLSSLCNAPDDLDLLVNLRGSDGLSGSMGMGPGADRARATADRLAFYSWAGLSPDQVILGKQVHSNTVRAVNQQDAGRGSCDIETAVESVDGLVTDAVDLALGVVVADCWPVMAWCERTGAIGIAHAGWRGTIQSIAAGLVETMTQTYGCLVQEMKFCLGPGIGVCCYRIGNELADRFSEAGDLADAVVHDESGALLDLGKANLLVLKRIGVHESQVKILPYCTSCDEKRFFSHRRDSDGGRNMVLIARRSR